MWGTDATTCLTVREGTATVSVAIDHDTAECVGIHAARPGTRFEALESIRQAVRRVLGATRPVSRRGSRCDTITAANSQ